MSNCKNDSCKKEFCKKSAKGEGSAPKTKECCAPKKDAQSPKSCGCKKI